MICTPLIVLFAYCIDPEPNGRFQHLNSIPVGAGTAGIYIPATGELTGQITATDIWSPHVLGYRNGRVVLGPNCSPITGSCDDGTVLTITGHTATCSDGWTLVLAHDGPACARELEPPQ